MFLLVFLGIVQGLTEFLPISSSGHLYLVKEILRIKEDYFSLFILLHIATLLALLLFFSKSLHLLLNKKLLLNIVIVTCLTAVLGLAIKVYLRDFFGNKYLLLTCFLINSLILLKTSPNRAGKSCCDIDWKDSIVVGLLQGLSPFPGISRSGITIAGLLKRGFRNQDSFVLAFLLAIPVIIGALILELADFNLSGLIFPDVSAGFIAAFISGLAALTIVKKTLDTVYFKRFGYYCLFICCLILLNSLIGR
ncbi:MAG: undecaprenyl-diphosphate phosphatase [Candidatus Omnitrophota bacterium]